MRAHEVPPAAAVPQLRRLVPALDGAPIAGAHLCIHYISNVRGEGVGHSCVPAEPMTTRAWGQQVAQAGLSHSLRRCLASKKDGLCSDRWQMLGPAQLLHCSSGHDDVQPNGSLGSALASQPARTADMMCEMMPAQDDPRHSQGPLVGP